MDNTLTCAVCDAFALGVPLAPASPVAGGLTNRVWRVQTDRGVFAVKQMNRDPARADYVAWFDRAFALEQAAYAAAIPMPRPIPVAATGSCLAQVAAGDGTMITVRAHEWVEGASLEGGVVYPDRDLVRIAAVHAQIHALRVPVAVTSSEALRVFGDEHWRAIADRARDAGDGWSEDLRGLLPALHDLEQYVRAAHADPTPLLLGHRDSDQKNFIRTANDELLLVDWDQAGPVNPRHDVANHALVWGGVHRAEPDPHAVRTFVAAYRDAANTSESFRETDLAELVALRLAWLDFNLRRALGEQTLDEHDRLAGIAVLHRNVTQVPRILHNLDPWLALLNTA